MNDIAASSAWTGLSRLASGPRRSLRALFAADPDRAAAMSLEAAGLYVDFSKNRIDRATLAALLDLAAAAGLEAARDAMFAGEKINSTERRAVLHVALREFSGARYPVEEGDAATLAAG